MSELNLGDKAPAFSLETDTDGTVGNDTFKGQWLVVYFYPKDNTSGCTKEAVSFTEHAADFQKLGASILGISKDSLKSHGNFREKHNLSVLLGSDPEGQVCAAFGVWVEKSMYGRKYMGIERSTFLINPDGKLVEQWRKVKVPGHVEKVLKALQEAQVEA